MNGMIVSVTQFISYLALVEAGVSAASIVGLYKPLADNNIDEINRILSATKRFYYRSGIAYVLLLVGLEQKAESYPNELSGGEQQRVAIARALVNNPSTIIADEPTGNLDPERSMEIMTLLVKINQLGTTVLVVTHEKDLVNKFGKRVITIDKGCIINDSVGGYVGGHIHEKA